MFKLSRVSCTPVESSGPKSKDPPAESREDAPVGGRKRSGRRRRNTNRRKNQVEPAMAKPHDAPMSKSDLYFALDCEMVGVGPGGVDSALARVSIVNWENEIVLDKHVKVSVPVTDYRTHVSGIRKEDLDSPDAMVFEDCRSAVKNILLGKILIGHGLENDLNALRLTHPRSDVRDTATYKPLMRELVHEDKAIWIPKKLRDLAWEKLERQIQVGGNAHSPLEDAITALDVYKSVRRSWEQDLVKESMQKEIEAEKQRLRLESQIYASVTSQNVVAQQMNRIQPSVSRENYKFYYSRSYPHQPSQSPSHGLSSRQVTQTPPQSVQYIATAPSTESQGRQVVSPNYVYNGTNHDIPYQPVYHYATAPPPPAANSFFRLPQNLVPVYFQNKSARRSKRQQQRVGESSPVAAESMVTPEAQ